MPWSSVGRFPKGKGRGQRTGAPLRINAQLGGGKGKAGEAAARSASGEQAAAAGGRRRPAGGTAVSVRGERERVKRAAVAVGPGNRGGPVAEKKEKRRWAAEKGWAAG
jgi:hypothetical protein